HHHALAHREHTVLVVAKRPQVPVGITRSDDVAVGIVAVALAIDETRAVGTLADADAGQEPPSRAPKRQTHERLAVVVMSLFARRASGRAEASDDRGQAQQPSPTRSGFGGDHFARFVELVAATLRVA